MIRINSVNDLVLILKDEMELSRKWKIGEEW